LADFSSRVAAKVIDWFFLDLISIVTVMPVVLAIMLPIGLHVLPETQYDVNGQPIPWTSGRVFDVVAYSLGGFVLFLFLFTILFYLYFSEFMWRTGTTPGKRLMKLRIIPLEPNVRLTRKMAAKRFWVEWGLSWLSISLVDYLWPLWDKQYQQCLHDKWPRTCVIKERQTEGQTTPEPTTR
jgi:uncharacterized RDD family membrane protein YckC